MFETNDHFLLWCQKSSLSKSAIELVSEIRNSPPSRGVKAGASNVSGFYPSKKMRVTIQFESHKNELAHIRLLEDNEKVIEYYDQPNKIYLNYESVNGRRIGVNHTPDFFTIYDDGAAWHECKTEQSLLDLEAHNPNRYCRDSEGNWRCPPGEEYAGKYGFFYRVISSKTINWMFQRNMEFLEDYFRESNLTVDNSRRSTIISSVSQIPGISLEELFAHTENTTTRDDIFTLIALNEIYIDLYRVPIPEFK